MSDLVTLTTFENAVQAHLCRSFLSSEGDGDAGFNRGSTEFNGYLTPEDVEMLRKQCCPCACR